MQETRVRSLGWEDSLEKEMATTPLFLPGESEESGRLQSMGWQKVGHDLATQPPPPNPRLERTSTG